LISSFSQFDRRRNNLKNSWQALGFLPRAFTHFLISPHPVNKEAMTGTFQNPSTQEGIAKPVLEARFNLVDLIRRNEAAIARATRVFQALAELNEAAQFQPAQSENHACFELWNENPPYVGDLDNNDPAIPVPACAIMAAA
jgi:hypothetical protein